MVSDFEELIKIINYLILHRPTLNAAIHHEIKHYLFAKGFKRMGDYKQQEERDYLKYKDSSQEELESLLSELYAIWKQTQGTGFGQFTEKDLKLFFNSFNPSEEPYVVNLKSRVREFGIEKIIPQMLKFPIQKKLDEDTLRSEIEFSKLFSLKESNDNSLFRKLTPEEEKQRHEHFEAFAKKVMGPGFIPLYKEDILDTYEQMKKHGKI